VIAGAGRGWEAWAFSGASSSDKNFAVPAELRGPKPSIASPDAGKHIAFLKDALDASIVGIWPADALEASSPVAHATLEMDGGLFYLFDDSTFDTHNNKNKGGACAIALDKTAASPEHLHDLVTRMVTHGGTIMAKAQRGFWQAEGGLFAAVNDPFGFRWTLNYDPAEALLRRCNDAKAGLDVIVEKKYATS
jgi:YD repeat-containing protein